MQIIPNMSVKVTIIKTLTVKVNVNNTKYFWISYFCFQSLAVLLCQFIRIHNIFIIKMHWFMIKNVTPLLLCLLKSMEHLSSLLSEPWQF
jgi:hypothetical protein